MAAAPHTPAKRVVDEVSHAKQGRMRSAGPAVASPIFCLAKAPFALYNPCVEIGSF